MYLASGHVAYADPRGSGTFLAAPFDTDTLSVTGSAIPVLDDVRFFGSQSAHPYIAVSQTGTVVYASHDIGDASIMWVDRDGQTTSIRRESRIVGDIRLSPNGRTAVFHDEQGDIWTLDIERGSVDLLVQGDFEVGYVNEKPIWHPDGTHVTFGANGDGSWNLYEIDVTTRGEPTVLLVRPRDQYAGSWSGDGQFLVFAEEHPETGADIWLLPRGEEPTPIVQTAANEFSPVLSADGDLVAFVSDETGRAEVYVRSLVNGEMRRASLNGGWEPVWSKQSRELFFRQGDQLYSVNVTPGPVVDVSTPTALFELAFERSMVGQNTYSAAEYDLAPEGDRFLVVSERPTTEFKVILNWFQELTERVPMPWRNGSMAHPAGCFYTRGGLHIAV
jgi:Tol biopolymer transport system component